VLDPLTAAMLVMITFVGGLIFIYSVGYMAEDENFTRFFCFLSLFAGAMLGVVVANSLLLLFISWELVGLASYLLIGFWYAKPSAAAAAKKAFIVTRIGDLGLFLGMIWLYSRSGTLLFYDSGRGCLEPEALDRLAGQWTAGGLAVSTCIGLLIFCGAIGKSGQVPLHVWLPDAMEGPTPVSALIHAATMVAAGVFLVARVYPLLATDPTPMAGQSTALAAVAWVGAITAAFAALIAVAQNDIKRILAYSTVSQLGYMMLGLGTGGVAVGMFHLLTHAFFKALLFLGSGSVIHACHHEQDIRQMGGLRRFMPVTFATYAIGMMALAGVPLFFSGFWSKDEILHSALSWPLSRGPFYLGLFGALLTAFYMTRQVAYVFYGSFRGERPPHESPRVMTLPLVILAVCTLLLSVVGTPLWPWIHHYLSATDSPHPGGSSVWLVMVISTAVVFTGIWMGAKLYRELPAPEEPDPLQRLQPGVFAVLRGKFYVDELYAATVVQAARWCGSVADWLDRWVWGGLVRLTSGLVTALSWLGRLFDEYVVNAGFDGGCESMRRSGRWLGRFQNGQVHRYLRVVGLGLVALALWLLGA
jgi:NADH-quinone oxidoreductase subunit L